jgi:hypothetical protein
MIDLVQHSIINKVEIDVPQTNNLNLTDVLCEVMKNLNTNFENSIDKLVKQINSSKQTTIYFTEDLCRMYNVSESTIYNYRKTGKLQYCNDGQKVWFTQEHIDAFNWLCDSRNKQSTLRKMA